MKTILTIDVGTSSTKTVLWDVNGALLADATFAYAVDYQQANWAQIDVRIWWDAVKKTTREVIAKSGATADSVVGIGIDAVGWTLVSVDQQGEPLHPAMLWLDRRAEKQANWLRQQPEANHWVDLVANPLDAAYITPKLLWLKAHEPALFDRTHMFLNATGYIVYKLSNMFTCDYTQAYGFHCFDIREERWDTSACDQIGIPREKLPPLYAPYDIVGQLTTQSAEELGLVAGVPVIAGGLDASIGAFGAGALKTGQTVDQGGQAGGMLMTVDEVIVEPRLIFSHHIMPKRYYLQSGTVGGGGVLVWFRKILEDAGLSGTFTGKDAFQQMSAVAQQTPAGSNGLIFLPYMAGERTPLWNTQARGVFFGLSFSTALSDIVRAMMEGCAFAVYHNLHIAEEHGLQVDEWIGNGGAARSDVWNQIKADISGRPFTVKRQANGEDGGHLLGLMAMVAQATGYSDDMGELIEQSLPHRHIYEPDLKRHAFYQDMFQVYKSLSEKLLPEFDSLANCLATHQQHVKG